MLNLKDEERNGPLPTTRCDDDDDERVPFSALIRRACWRVRPWPSRII